MSEKSLGHRPLKEAGSKAIEEAIAKAISEIAGEEYKVDISNLDFESTNNAWVSDKVKIILTVSKKESAIHSFFARQPSENFPPKAESEGKAPVTAATCRLCDSSGFRLVKDKRQPTGAARKCTHDPVVEAEIPAFYN